MKKKKLKVGDYVVGAEPAFRGIVLDFKEVMSGRLCHIYWYDEPDASARQKTWDYEVDLLDCMREHGMIE